MSSVKIANGGHLKTLLRFLFLTIERQQVLDFDNELKILSLG